MITVKIINTSTNPIPTYETSGSAGADLYSANPLPIIIKPGQRVKVPTGLFIELPEGYEAQIRSRSGMSLKYGIVVANGVGTIDSDYRGEIGIILHNISNEDYELIYGQRIAQMVIAEYVQADFVKTEQINLTKRGCGGFGHTGK